MLSQPGGVACSDAGCAQETRGQKPDLTHQLAWGDFSLQNFVPTHSQLSRLITLRHETFEEALALDRICMAKSRVRTLSFLLALIEPHGAPKMGGRRAGTQHDLVQAQLVAACV